ncbi:hypothetical protein HOLleu_09516 [Holothuria leucospilota]|uniref:Uncharacterized protein n=1 Tax=Holothuria leucospilota TaxID=206669 RepID=A0A9Q1CDU1_HOLLE|nr:hypothetical protein HOLleu_09516 [Holothuria leucospilota]
MDVIQEFAIRKGSEVYSYVKRKGYQIRKVDVHKSLSRLFPKGLHRKASSIVKQSWDHSSEPHPSDISYIVTQEHGVGTGENVVMLNPEDFAQLMNGEGSIVLVDQEGTRRGGELVVVSEEQGSNISTSIVNTVVPTETSQQMVKPGEDQISAIILEIDFPENQTNGVSVEGSDHMGDQGSTHMLQSGATQHLCQDVVVVDETQRKEHIRDVALLDTDPKSSDNVTSSDEPQLIIDYPEVADPQEQTSSAEQEVSLTSLNTVRPSELDAQVLLELDRIAQNYQATKDGHSLVVPQQTNSGEGVL